VKKYKVLLSNNKAVSAEPVAITQSNHIKINRDGNRTSIEWFVVYANDEGDAVSLVDELMAEDVWQHVLSRN
jgi:hypothetical protein